MIPWTDHSNHRRRRFQCDAVTGSLDGVFRDMLDLVLGALIGHGNAGDADALFLEVDADSDRFTLAAGTVEKRMRGVVDACTVVMPAWREACQDLVDPRLEPLPAGVDEVAIASAMVFITVARERCRDHPRIGRILISGPDLNHAWFDVRPPFALPTAVGGVRLPRIAYHHQDYTVTVICGDPGRAPLWMAGGLDAIIGDMATLVASSRGAAAMQAQQRRGEAAERYGMMDLEPSWVEKLIHQGPGDPRRFLFLDIWSPREGICHRQMMAPDAYLRIDNVLLNPGWGVRAAFNPLVVVATRHGGDADGHHDALVRCLWAKTGGRRFRAGRMPWGEDLPPGDGEGYQRGIKYLTTEWLFRPGTDPHRGDPADALTSGFTEFMP